MEEFRFTNLIVWQKAMQFSEMVYALVRHFPDDERYALSDQLRRAAVSVPSNIAEGAGRAGNRDYAHFLSIARGSLYETMTQLEMAARLGYISPLDADEHEPLMSLAKELARMLGSMLKKYGVIQSSKTQPPLFDFDS